MNERKILEGGGADRDCIVLEGCTFGEVSCMQVIPFHCVFISNGALFDDDVNKIVSSLIRMGIFHVGGFLGWAWGGSSKHIHVSL